MEEESKKAFISYSREDRDFAEKLANAIIKNGVDVFWADWEIKPGDSLIDKIFTQGIGNWDIFLIILSNVSVKSRWVKEELDSAAIRRIQGLTKIIPVLKEKCEIPTVILSLAWVDISDNFDDGVKKILKAIFDVSDKPPIGDIPDYITSLVDNVGNLSKIASSVAHKLIKNDDEQTGFELSYEGDEIHSFLPELSPQDIDDSVDELSEHGFVKTGRYIGTAPYSFGCLEPTYRIFIYFFENDLLSYDPYEDVKKVVAITASLESATGDKIREISGLTPLRINRAVSYIEDYALANVHKFMGSAPFKFSIIEATRKTRQTASEA